MSLPNTRRRLQQALLAAALALPLMAAAQDATPVKFVLDWKLQGVHAWYFLAQDRGYFAQEKIDITIDQGDGSWRVRTRRRSATSTPSSRTRRPSRGRRR